MHSSLRLCSSLFAEELRHENVTEIRRWAKDELGGPHAIFAPRRLPELVRALPPTARRRTSGCDYGARRDAYGASTASQPPS